jgi:Holliday junction resolvase RusA-like endonuclease
MEGTAPVTTIHGQEDAADRFAAITGDDAAGYMPVVFMVHGTPAPQGSKKPITLRSGQVVLVESSDKVKPWRAAVETAALKAFRRPFTGPVAVTLNFYLRRPPSIPARITHPGKYPDLDKLCRSTLDGLKTGGAYIDDGQVVSMPCSKEFGEPGCLISVRELGGCIR